MKRRILFISVCVMLFLGLLVYWYKSSSLGTKQISGKLELLKQFGSADASKPETIGLISSFTLDKNENLYVVDPAFEDVKEFSEDGRFIRSYGYGGGSGPGEFRAPNGAFVDSAGNVYVIDEANLNVTVFDSLNHLIATLHLPFIPAQVIAMGLTKVDISGFPFFYKGDLISSYDLTRESSDKPEMTYCQRLTGKDAEIGFRSGNSGRLLISPLGDIYFSFFYPYVINKYSQSGKLLLSIRSDREIPPAIFNPSTNIAPRISGIKELVILPNDTIMALFDEVTMGNQRQYFDFYDGKTGSFLGSIPCKKLGLDKVRFMRADRQGNIYMDIVNPYPHIMKYRLTLRFQ